MMKVVKKYILLFLSLIILCLGQSVASAYEEITVISGGTLEGQVFLTGTPPPARIFHLIFSPNIEFCRDISDGKGNRLLQEFHVSSDGGFQDVVVALVGVKKGKPFDYTPIIWIENCQIKPFVTPVRNNHPITISSVDPITHDIQAYTLKDEYTFAMFNKPMPARASVTKEIVFRKGHYIFRTQCGVHDYMQSWGMAVGNPYFAVTDREGRFIISDIPPGTYYLVAWHPHMEVQAREVTISANGRVSADFSFDANEVHIPLHDLQLNYRLGTWLEPRHLVPPKVKLQVLQEELIDVNSFRRGESVHEDNHGTLLMNFRNK
ncbi:MAG: carboxypeptidase-like regulatory domain-containing protein [Nitrospira sp.]